MKHTEMIMVIEAHSEGKTIECTVKDANEWSTTKQPEFNFMDCDYRVKAETIYHVEHISIYQVGHVKMVSINALKDALSLSCSNDDAERRLYLKLEELIK